MGRANCDRDVEGEEAMSNVDPGRLLLNAPLRWEGNEYAQMENDQGWNTMGALVLGRRLESATYLGTLVAFPIRVI